MSEIKLEKFLNYLRSQGLLKDTAPDNTKIIENYSNYASASTSRRIPDGYQGFTQGKKKD